MTTTIKKPHYWGFDSLTTKRPLAISLTSVRQLGLPAFWLVLATLPVWAAIASRAAISSLFSLIAIGLGLLMLCTNPSVSVEPFAFTQGAYSFKLGEHIAVDCLLFNCSFIFVYYPDCDFICVFHFMSPFRLIKYIHSIKDKYILVKRFEYQFGKLVVQS